MYCSVTRLKTHFHLACDVTPAETTACLSAFLYWVLDDTGVRSEKIYRLF
jgi:hypothetical protein